MLTKFILHINNTSYELRDDDLKNWDEVRCAYKRANYDGVVRSFTSQFEFVNRAYELLQKLYLKDRFSAIASIEVQTIDDRWVYHTQFACPLDFSTITWNNYVLSIHSVDNSLAALIKANKGTKYEFNVGPDIPTDKPLRFERIPMTEVLDFRVVGESNDEDDSMILTHPGGVGRIERVYSALENSSVINEGYFSYYGDQTTATDSYMLVAARDVQVKINGGIAIDRINGCKNINFRITLYKTDDAGTVEIGDLASQSFVINYLGEFDTPSDLPVLSPLDLSTPAFVKSTNTIWKWWVDENATNETDLFTWVDIGKSIDGYNRTIVPNQYTVDLKEGDKLWIGMTANPGLLEHYGNYWVRICNQEISISWGGVGETVTIDTITPKNLCDKLFERIAGKKLCINSHFSNFDSRLANTYLLAAESIRAIPTAKIYSSFTEFTDWMQTVFGYTYYIGPLQKSRYTGRLPFNDVWSLGAYSKLVDDVCPLENIGELLFISDHRVFTVFNNKDGNFYTRWPKTALHDGHESYNDINNKARLDKIYFDRLNKSYYIDENYQLKQYLYDSTKYDCDVQDVFFVHRSELLKSDAGMRRIDRCNNIKYSVDSGTIYSAVTVGYDKKDYEGFNGRDEFNFNNTYSTGCTVTDKTLSLLSKYRADCYGIEFTSQKRGSDTTDSSSDKDVFFLLCEDNLGCLVPDRSVKIENTVSDSVFNGAFSPVACVKANAGFIGLQADKMTLSFASSTGNSDIVIDGVPMNGNILIDKPIATCGLVEFTTDEIGMWNDANDLIEIENDGVIYRGYMREVEFKYAHTESAKYKLIIKDIEL